MAVFIPEDKISEVKNAADIVDIVSEAVLLKKAGKTPSVFVRFIQKKLLHLQSARTNRSFTVLDAGPAETFSVSS